MDKRFNRIYLGLTACLFGFGALVGSINSLKANNVQAANGIYEIASFTNYFTDSQSDISIYVVDNFEGKVYGNRIDEPLIYPQLAFRVAWFPSIGGVSNYTFEVNGSYYFSDLNFSYSSFGLEVYCIHDDEFVSLSNGVVICSYDYSKSFYIDPSILPEEIVFKCYVSNEDSRLTDSMTRSQMESVYNSGFGAGYGSGYSNGYSIGYSGGFTQGYNTGQDNPNYDIWGMIGGVLSMPFTFIQQAFDVTLFAGTAYAFPVGNVIYSFFAIALLVAIIKLILGR